MFGTTEVFVHAKDLLGIPSVTPAPVLGGFTFYHLLLPHHEVILANGAVTKSLYLGAGTRKALTSNARADLCKLTEFKQMLGTAIPARILPLERKPVD
jgi:hypothetical protein